MKTHQSLANISNQSRYQHIETTLHTPFLTLNKDPRHLLSRTTWARMRNYS